MSKKIQSALISVFNKEGLESIVKLLQDLSVTIYSTGGTQHFIEKLGGKVIPVEQITSYPSILGGRVKTLHPSVFGGILGRRYLEEDLKEMKQFNIPVFDLVIVDLYPFEETVRTTTDESLIIEKIDIGGPAMIRAAAKNFKDVCVVAAKKDYAPLETLLREQKGICTIEQRKKFAALAFEVVAHYDIVISKFFTPHNEQFFQESIAHSSVLRYGENPHQTGVFYGNLSTLFEQLNGKELSYNNLVDIDAALQLIKEFEPPVLQNDTKTFAIIKHTNVCGVAQRKTLKESWLAAKAGDPESAFGGVLICNSAIDPETALEINELFFEVLIAPKFEPESLTLLKSKKNRILLQLNSALPVLEKNTHRSLLNGVLIQSTDSGNYKEWQELGGRNSSSSEQVDLVFANIICKHLKSNSIAIVKNLQLIGKGCGQTSRIDALRQALEKVSQFNFSTKGAVLASDAFFPFNDCVKLGHEAGIEAFIQPGGSVRDKDSIDYCLENKLALVMTQIRHFKH